MAFGLLGIPTPQRQGSFLDDPRTMGLLAAGLGILGAQNTYGALGPAISQGGMLGLQAMQQAKQMQQQKRDQDFTRYIQGQRLDVDRKQLGIQEGLFGLKSRELDYAQDLMRRRQAAVQDPEQPQIGTIPQPTVTAEELPSATMQGAIGSLQEFPGMRFPMRETLGDPAPIFPPEVDAAIKSGELKYKLNPDNTVSFLDRYDQQLAASGRGTAPDVAVTGRRLPDNPYRPTADAERARANRLMQLGDEDSIRLATAKLNEADRLYALAEKWDAQQQGVPIPGQGYARMMPDGTVKIDEELFSRALKEREAGAARFDQKLDLSETQSKLRRTEAMVNSDIKFRDELRDSAKAGARLQMVVQRALKATETDKTYTGFSANFATSLGNVAASLGIPVDKNQVAASEAYIADLAEVIRNQIKAMGSGSGISNIDLLFTERGSAALTKTKQGRIAILKALELDLQNMQSTAQSADAHLRKNGDLGGWQPPQPRTFDFDSVINPTFDKLPPAVKYKGQTVVDEQTGKRFKSDGLIWKEVK